MKTDTPLLPKLIEYNFNFYGRDITLYLKPLELMTGYILNSGVFYEVNNLVHIYNKFPKCGTIVDAGANQGNHATFFS